MATPTRVPDPVLDPVFSDILPPEVNARLADAAVPEEVKRRMEVLADKASDGALTEQERAEYRRLIDAADVLAILRIRARRALGRPAVGASGEAV